MKQKAGEKDRRASYIIHVVAGGRAKVVGIAAIF
jgi:hypothetical protein